MSTYIVQCCCCFTSSIIACTLAVTRLGEVKHWNLVLCCLLLFPSKLMLQSVLNRANLILLPHDKETKRGSCGLTKRLQWKCKLKCTCCIIFCMEVICMFATSSLRKFTYGVHNLALSCVLMIINLVVKDSFVIRSSSLFTVTVISYYFFLLTLRTLVSHA